MINNVKSNYRNPLTMMKSNRQAEHFNLGAMKTEEKKQKALEAEKQLIQNSLLLMKGTSGNGETSEENIKLLEQKLEEITKEIKTSSKETIEEAAATGEKDAEEHILPRKDTVTISQMGKASILEEYSQE